MGIPARPRWQGCWRGLAVSETRKIEVPLITVAFDPVAQVLTGDPEALSNFSGLVAALGDLLHPLDLEFFRVVFPAHIHTFCFALVLRCQVSTIVGACH